MQYAPRLVGAAAGVTLVMASVANAEIMEVTINSTWASTVSSMQTFDMPAVASIDAITVEIAHLAIFDFDPMTLSGPGNFFELLDENSSADGQNANLGMVLGDPSLDNVAPYVFRPTGDVTFDLSQEDLLGGYDPIRANEWSAGGAEAGIYNFGWRDDEPEAGGSIGRLIIEYTPATPAPGTLAVLGLAGLASTGRRRRG